MIITNGNIAFKKKISLGIDSNTGYPVPPTSEWGEDIPCQYIVNSYDNLGRANGEHFIKAQYSILVEQPISIESEQLRLIAVNGKELGEFSIISIEHLDAVNQIKIIV